MIALIVFTAQFITLLSYGTINVDAQNPTAEPGISERF